MLGISMYFIPYCNGQHGVLPCKDSVESKVCFLVDKWEDYVPENDPEPLPVSLNTTFHVQNIIDVDIEKETVTLAMKITLEWYDPRVSVNNPLM